MEASQEVRQEESGQGERSMEPVLVEPQPSAAANGESSMVNDNSLILKNNHKTFLISCSSLFKIPLKLPSLQRRKKLEVNIGRIQVSNCLILFNSLITSVHHSVNLYS